MRNLRTPLGTVLGSGSAKDGTDHFWVQRVTAAALLLLGTWFVLAIPGALEGGRESLLAWAAAPWNSILLILLSISLAWHSSLGVQVVIEDYVHGPFIKVVSLVLSKFAHVLVVVATVFAVLKIAFGGVA